MSPTMQMSVWTSYAPTMTIASQDIQALARWLVTSDASSIGRVSSIRHRLCAVLLNLLLKQINPPQAFQSSLIPPNCHTTLGFYFHGEGLPLSDGYDTILVIVCRLSKMALFIATHQDIDAKDLAMLFLVHIFSKHGTPSDIISDCGKHFISRFWRSLC